MDVKKLQGAHGAKTRKDTTTMGNVEMGVARMTTLALAFRQQFFIGQCECHMNIPDFMVSFRDQMVCPMCGDIVNLQRLNIAGGYDAIKPRETIFNLQ
jgi:hypothetical protein